MKHKKRCESLPPGPPSLPIVGSLPFLKVKHGLANTLVNKNLYHYDPKFCTVWIGSRPVIMIQDFQLAKEIFARDEFSGRPNNYHSKYIRGMEGEALGIIPTVGKLWQEQRRFTLKHLKDFGFGRNKLDTIIQEEANDLIQTLLSKSNIGDVLIDSIFNFPIINVLWQIVASKKYDPNLSESQTMMQKVGIVFHEGPDLINYLIQSPSIRSMIPKTNKEIAELEVKDMFRKQILEHKHELEFDESLEPRDFIDVYLKEIGSYEKVEVSKTQANKYSKFSTEQLVSICLDLFQAGSETSSTTLSWAIMLLMLFPEAQEKCLDEIEAIIGDKLPSKDDASKLIYCVATIQEIQRIACVAPASLFHSVTKDLLLEGYHIKKGQNFIVNLTKIMKDPYVFPNPDEFNPDRFIQNSTEATFGGRKLKNVGHFVPFGIGKRICAGESLANSELFIFFVMMVQRLKISKPMNHSLPTIYDYKAKFTNIPSPFYVSITSR